MYWQLSIDTVIGTVSHVDHRCQPFIIFRNNHIILLFRCEIKTMRYFINKQGLFL